MSLVAIGWAWKQSGLDPTEKLVLLALADHHNESSHRCNPSNATLAERACVSERTVQRSIRKLEGKGLVRREEKDLNGRQTSNQYALVMLSVGVTPVTPRPDTGDTPGDDTGDTRTFTKNQGEGDKSPSPARVRKPDPLWEVLVEELGEPSTKSERGRRNRALAELREAEVDAPELERLIAAYRKHPTYASCALTATALAANLSVLRQAVAPARRRVAKPPCSECGVGGGLHVADCSRAVAA